MLENEAKMKVCPFMSEGHERLSNHGPETIITKVLCMGSECMKWKTTGESYVDKSFKQRGLCGV
jgi:hypothetical protein